MHSRLFDSRNLLRLAMVFFVACAAYSFLPNIDSSGTVYAQDAEPAEAAPAAEGETTPEPPKNLLSWLVESLGWLYILVFLSLSFILVALFIMNLLSARRESVCPQLL